MSIKHWFISKEDKERKKKEEELRTRVQIKKFITTSRSKEEKFNEMAQKYINQAHEAKQAKDKVRYNTIRNSLRKVMFNKHISQTIIFQFESLLDEIDMLKMFSEMGESLGLITRQITSLTKSANFKNAYSELQKALTGTQESYKDVASVLAMASEQYEQIGDTGVVITDDELDDIIECNAGRAENEIQEDLEQRIQQLNIEE